MPLFTDAERGFVEALSELVYTNPFTPERIALERRALGAEFVEDAAAWSATGSPGGGTPASPDRPNVVLLRRRTEPLAAMLRERLVAAAGPIGRDELVLYEDLALYVLYESVRDDLHEAAERTVGGSGSAGSGAGEPPIAGAWARFGEGYRRFFGVPGVVLPTGHRPEHVFASFFQIRRAFSHIFHYLVGGSGPAIGLRAAVWESIFTHDFRRYYAGLYTRMADYTTLVTGASGTGKELVARAIGRSRYIPFDPSKGRFAEDFAASFHAVNLSALSPTLIESELFGHKKGSFTGAVVDRAGWLEACPAMGTVFLDEIGELDPLIQVKLLRVLQARTFTRLGETSERRFEGKIIAATNRDLAEEIRRGAFRQDFYYRLCSDVIATPGLREQLADRPADLHPLVLHVTRRLAPEVAGELAERVTAWIEKHLGRDYAWPGNFRELEQCVRNLVIRGRYQPVELQSHGQRPLDRLAAAMCRGEFTADELLSRYVTVVYSQTGTYHGAAEKLGVDRRTVRAKIDEELLAKLRNGEPGAPPPPPREPLSAGDEAA